MFKKVGMVTVGVTAGMLAAAPFASAGEAPDPGHDPGHHRHHSGQSCELTGGDAAAAGEISGNAGLGNVLGQLPIGGNNIGNVVCDNILNHNLNGNSVDLDVL